MTSKTQQLIKEARRLSTNIEKDRAEGKTPSPDCIARLDEVSKFLINLRKQPPVFSEYPRSEGT
jgi:hypothetical protein